NPLPIPGLAIEQAESRRGPNLAVRIKEQTNEGIRIRETMAGRSKLGGTGRKNVDFVLSSNPQIAHAIRNNRSPGIGGKTECGSRFLESRIIAQNAEACSAGRPDRVPRHVDAMDPWIPFRR